MLYHSLKNSEPHYSFLEALGNGLAPDGSLLVPNTFPAALQQTFSSLTEFAISFMADFTSEQDPPLDLVAACQHAYAAPQPITPIDQAGHLWALELFHSATGSFKDFGAQFLAACLKQIPNSKPRLLLVATSGDTGAAIAHAFHHDTNTRVIVLYPKDKISTFQANMLSSFGDNVSVFKIDGDFDDCQHLVKKLLHDDALQKKYQVTTGNSINLARLLAQCTYMAYASIQWQAQHQTPMNIIVPSGNMGHVCAVIWAKQMGYPIHRIAMAFNSNDTVATFYHKGLYTKQPTKITLANAMDVGNPSNFERIHDLYQDHQLWQTEFDICTVSDEQIQAAIQQAYQEYGIILCPHSATGFHLFEQLKNKQQPWVLACTATPAKFNHIIQDCIQQKAPIPATLQCCESSDNHTIELNNHYQDVLNAILN